MEPLFKPIELSFPVPKHPHLTLHAHLTFLEHSSMIHLTTSDVGESTNPSPPLGSFVYAMPDRLDSRNTISTALSTTGSSIDYATRLSKILARKLNQPVYVGCSMNFSGVSTEEEMEGLRVIVLKVVEAWGRSRS